MEGVGTQRNRNENQHTQITKTDERKLNNFQSQCLRRKLRMRWQQRMTNKRVVEMAEINEISCEVRRRWREGGNDCFTALGWTLEGRKARGRPKTTWRRTVQRKREARRGGRAGMWPRRRHATGGV